MRRHLRFISAFAFAFFCALTLSAVGSAQETDRCSPGERANLGSLNGLYYFDGSTTQRVQTTDRAQQPGTENARLIFDVKGAGNALTYSPDGRFYLLSDRKVNDAGERLYFGTWPSERGEEVAVIRRLTQSNAEFDNPSRFVSLTRSTLETLCGADIPQEGLGNRGVYFKQKDYFNFHAGLAGNTQATTFARQFHFRWSRAQDLCESTNLFDHDDENLSRNEIEYDDYRLTYIGDPRPRSVTRAEGALTEIAQVLLPKPAFASRVDPEASAIDRQTTQRVLARVSSTEVSLHRLRPGETEVCLAFDAPLPTSFDVRNFWWNRAERTRSAALDLARSGEWSPTQTEIHIQNTVQRDRSMLIRLYWAVR